MNAWMNNILGGILGLRILYSVMIRPLYQYYNYTLLSLLSQEHLQYLEEKLKETETENERLEKENQNLRDLVTRLSIQVLLYVVFISPI